MDPMPNSLHAIDQPMATFFFKFHTRNKNNLYEVEILYIPTKFLQSAGNIKTSRITEFVKRIFKTIKINYMHCQIHLNEYFKDSNQCLKELEN